MTKGGDILGQPRQPVKLPEQEPWKALPTEDWSSYQRFLRYLHMEPPRSIVRLADESDRSRSSWYTVSSRFGWLRRAQAYDQWVADQIIESEVEEQKRLRREHLRALSEARILAEEKLRALRENPAMLLETISPRDAIVFLKEAILLERVITNQVTDRVETTEKVDLRGLSDEEFEALEALQAKATGR